VSADAQETEQELEQEPEQEPGTDEVVLVVENALSQNPVIVLDLLIGALRRAKDALQVPTGRWHVVIAPDAEPAYVRGFDTLDGLLAVCRDARGKGYQIFGFSPRGELLLPSKGGHYLVTPGGRYPLFAEDHDAEVDPSGYLGPAPIKPAVQAHGGNGDDEEIEDEEEDDEEDEGGAGGEEEEEDEVDDEAG
jgi:hypothetical protein